MIDASDLERFGIPQPEQPPHAAIDRNERRSGAPSGVFQPLTTTWNFPDTAIPASEENQRVTKLIESLETPWLGDGSHKPREMEQAAEVIRSFLGKPRCTQPCQQLIALFASVERLEDIVFRIQREVAGMECLLAGLEARR